jgi:hypothetical protein
MSTNHKLIQTPWLNYFCEFVKSTKNELLVVAPFFSLEIINKILEYAGEGVELRFLLGAKLRGIAAGVSDYDALIRLHEISFQRNIIVRNIPNLHGKVMISDQTKAIISSSNLTRKGLQKNIEFGIELDGNSALELYRMVREYWNEAEVIKLNQGINNARKGLTSFQEKEKNREIPQIPLTLGNHICPKGNDVKASSPVAVIGQNVISPLQETLADPDKKQNLLFNVWWNDNQFRGACLDISNKTVCRSFFLKYYREDRTEECETYQNGCDSAYIFSNYAYYINTNLDNQFLNKCAFFISRNPDDNKYWIIGYLFIIEKGENFRYAKESGETGTIPRYIKGDESRSLRFQPYIVFNEGFIRQLPLGNKWGSKETSEVSWITHHTRSSASCTYLSNADAATILETYKNSSKNNRDKEILLEILKRYYYKPA